MMMTRITLYEDSATDKSNAEMPLISMWATYMYCIILEKYLGLISEKGMPNEHSLYYRQIRDHTKGILIIMVFTILC